MVLLHWEINYYYYSIRGAEKHLIFQKRLALRYVVSFTKASRLLKKNLTELLGSVIRVNDTLLYTSKLNLCTCILLEVYLHGSEEGRYLSFQLM